MKKINPKVVTAVMLLLGVLVAGGMTAIKEGAPAVANDDRGFDGIFCGCRRRRCAANTSKRET